MRKVDDQLVKDTFAGAIDALADAVVEVRDLAGAVKSPSPRTTKISAGTLKLVAQSALLAAVALWEGFLNDLFVAYINRDPSQFAKHWESRTKELVKEKLNRELEPYVSVDLGSHPTAEAIQSILDPKHRNYTFSSADEMISYAEKLLSTTRAAKFTSLSNSDRAAIDAWKAMRNYVAHGSTSSGTRMNTTLASSHLATNLKRGPNSVYAIGSFLAAYTAMNLRVENYLAVMKSVAAKL